MQSRCERVTRAHTHTEIVDSAKLAHDLFDVVAVVKQNLIRHGLADLHLHDQQQRALGRGFRSGFRCGHMLILWLRLGLAGSGADGCRSDATGGFRH